MDWIDVKKKLPPNDLLVLGWDGSAIRITYNRSDEVYEQHWIMFPDSPITHWMPLPKPPS